MADHDPRLMRLMQAELAEARRGLRTSDERRIGQGAFDRAGTGRFTVMARQTPIRKLPGLPAVAELRFHVFACAPDVARVAALPEAVSYPEHPAGFEYLDEVEEYVRSKQRDRKVIYFRTPVGAGGSGGSDA